VISFKYRLVSRSGHHLLNYFVFFLDTLGSSHTNDALMSSYKPTSEIARFIGIEVEIKFRLN